MDQESLIQKIPELSSIQSKKKLLKTVDGSEKKKLLKTVDGSDE